MKSPFKEILVNRTNEETTDALSYLRTFSQKNCINYEGMRRNENYMYTQK